MNTNGKTEGQGDVLIVCYSGTGCTMLVAEQLATAFAAHGRSAHILRLHGAAVPETPAHNQLVLVYAVHACNAPEPVHRWLQTAPPGEGRPAAVISVSGGGEVSPNTACRVSCLRRLKRLGYDTQYERMIVMPSNWIVATKEPLAVKLLDVLPERMERVVRDLLGGVRRRSHPPVWDRMFSLLGKIEHFGAHSYGERLQVEAGCTACGWCAAHCPAGNITMRNGKPDFANRCNLCLNCVYGCPAHALTPGIARFVSIPAGFSLKQLQQKCPWPEDVDVPALTKGYLWAGVRKYLMYPDR